MRMCPHCDHPKSRVIDCRESGNTKVLRRRRACQKCKGRWSTWETRHAIPTINVGEELVISMNGRLYEIAVTQILLETGHQKVISVDDRLPIEANFKKIQIQASLASGDT